MTSSDQAAYPRDLKGYGATPPQPHWPGQAKVAVQFVINIEEGGENNILHGDPTSEAFLTEEPAVALTGKRNVNVESQYEYGTRVGFWRLHRLFTERSLPVTVFGIAESLRRNPEIVTAANESDWEIASHSLRWINYAEVDEQVEREHIRQATETHAEVCGSRPLGWYTGRNSINTRRLVVEQGGFLYDSDSFSDDLPYWVDINGTAQLVIPYTLDNNDGRYVNGYGFGAESFSAYLTNGLELLLREGAEQPKMMSVGLHLRLSGRPGRAADLQRFLDVVAERPDVWVARRADIARHWRAVHPAAKALPATTDPLADQTNAESRANTTAGL
ncbi:MULTISPECIES: allantoinase PuuE [unclassified Actinopolyspora]|uniref:allantoinase PuuE n=1 Tax=unclassified Actinopolyspora TaxID=2639451 RepID=UPI0013F5F34D|nr:MULTISPECIES: allantoinase PuuE [unclassified Actinopolyspora]NHD17744.1 allantoinase PuuE [Actinopolyspora sp. BKK2]NHE76523.1 allantoinase PuuE [Actinopolyspora sp. BKK1]